MKIEGRCKTVTNVIEHIFNVFYHQNKTQNFIWNLKLICTAAYKPLVVATNLVLPIIPRVEGIKNTRLQILSCLFVNVVNSDIYTTIIYTVLMNTHT